MKRRWRFAFGTVLFGLSQPVFAQDAQSVPEASVTEKLADAFAASPLTEEEQARLPQAEAVVGKLLPPGTYRRLMDESLAPIMSTVTDSVKAIPIASIAAMAGLSVEDVEVLGDAEIGEIMAIVDPAFDRRIELTNQLTVSMVTDLMDEIEPAYRQGLSRAYAVRFDEAELADISRFFETPSGARYAEQSMLIFTDPQVLSVVGEMMPRLIEQLPTLTEKLTETLKDLPPPKRLDQLSDAERETLANLLQIPKDSFRADDESAASPEQD